ncbi:MAG: SDR family oxidoreductase [Ectothiorhodospiraceae bacterium]|nr:SDR family oxidoreductase [Chromatiales bacterium]MCP5155480.1 SDR family oxidoreductase [Ectothiorhodospiraceae bacterium]
MGSKLFDLDGRVALVTGSSQGIGHAIARGLGEAGARVVLNGRDLERLEGARAGLAAEGLAVEACGFDVVDGAAVDAAVATIEREIGPIEILVNNAGIQRRAPLHEVDDATWRTVLDVNLDGVFRVGRAVARHMLARGRGKIVNICSLMSEVGRPTTGPYTAAKGAVRMLTRAMCVDWAPAGLQVNGIGPGYFATELNRPLYENPEFDAWIKRRTPAGRWGRVEELVGAAVFLASDASSFVNGQVIYVDGGVLASL